MIDTCNLYQLSKKYKLNYKTLKTLRSQDKEKFIKYLYVNGLRFINEKEIPKKRKEIQITFEIMTTIPYESFLKLIEDNKKNNLVSRNSENIKSINVFPDYPETGSEEGFLYFKITNEGKIIQVLYNEYQNYYISEINFKKYEKFFLKYNIDYNKFIPLHRGNYYFRIPKRLGWDFLRDVQELIHNKQIDSTLVDYITKWKNQLIL